MATASPGKWPATMENEIPPMILNFAAVVTATIMTAGIIGNALTILAFWKTQRSNNVTTVFIVCLCAADLLFCLTVLPFNLVRFTVGGFKDRVTCKLLPFVQYGNVGVSLLFIAMITINRYVMIAHYHAYTKIYRTSFIVAMVLFCWFFSFGMQVPTLLGKWGKYDYDSRLASCTIMKDSNGRSAKSALFFVGFVIPCFIIIFCYTRIYIVVRRSESRMRKHALNNTKLSRKEQKEVKMKRNEWRITKMVLAIFLSFLVCYLPITIIKITDGEIKYPSYHILAYLLLYLSACINPIIYVIMNKQYRQAYKAVLTCHRPRLLSLRGRNTGLPDYKRKLISKCSNERKSNRFWHSILLTGPDYKLLRPSVSELKQRAHDSFTKYVLPEDANGQNNPKPYAPQLMNTWEPTNAAETQYQDQPPDVTVTTRALGDDQLENIKNKLLSHSPKTRDELDIIELILAADNSIGKEKLLHLARRERLPDFEDLVNLEREVNGPVSEDREDVQHCCLGCEDGMLEEPVNWRGFGSGTAHENGGDNSQIAGSTTTAHQETTTQSKKPCFEKVEDSIIYEYQHKDVNSEALRHFCRGSKSLIDTDRTSNVTLTKSLDPNVKMVQAEKLGECSLLNHENIKPRDCDNSNTDWYFSEPVNWRGFGGNWTSSEDLINENQGCLDSKSSKQNSVNFEETCSPKIRGTTENLELTRCSSLSCDEVCEEPESFRGFGGSWSDPESATGGSSVRFHPRMVSLRTISDSSTVDESRNVFANLQPILSCGSDEAAVSAPRRPGVETKCPTNSLRLKAGLVTASANGPSQETQKSNPIEPEDFEAIEGEDPLASTDFPYEDLNVMMHSLMFRFQDMPHSKTNEVDSFIRFCASRMKADICARIERETQEQAENSLWFKLKFGRVTASNLYSVAQCRTPGGYLVKSIIGLRTWFCGNEATMRGKRLEREVADLVGKRMKTKFHRCGIFLSGAYPILGASPDAINDTFVVEIKSPFSGRSYADYLEDGYKIGKRYMAQVQLQMFMTGRKKGLFCVAAPDFETSRRVEVITVDYDRELVVGLIDRATKFWKANIFPLLAEIKREADRPPPDYRPL